MFSSISTNEIVEFHLLVLLFDYEIITFTIRATCIGFYYNDVCHLLMSITFFFTSLFVFLAHSGYASEDSSTNDVCVNSTGRFG